MLTSLKKFKKVNEVNKHLHPTINAEILVKVGPSASELGVLKLTIKK